RNSGLVVVEIRAGGGAPASMKAFAFSLLSAQERKSHAAAWCGDAFEMLATQPYRTAAASKTPTYCIAGGAVEYLPALGVSSGSLMVLHQPDASVAIWPTSSWLNELTASKMVADAVPEGP